MGLVGLVFVLLFSCFAIGAFKELGAFKVTEPAFLTEVNGDLFITSFSGSPFTAGSIYRVPNIASALLDLSSVNVTKIVDGLVWPNLMTPSPLPGTLFVFGDGFLPPGKSTGSLSVVDTSFQSHSLTVPKKEWFYHRGRFFDVNGDGLPDIVTARGKKPIIGSAQGQLLWLENPGTNIFNPWKEHVLASGPDIDFDLVPLGPSKFVVYAAEFFAQKLTSFTIAAGKVVDSTVIDNTIGAVYTVVAVPNVGLFVSNYYYEEPGSVFLYSGAGYTKRTTVATGFQNVQWAPGSGAPGWLYPHYPNVNQNSGPLSLFVCGDGAETFSVVSPTSGVNKWNVTFQQYYGSTIGAALVGNWSGTGNTQVLVTDYNSGFVRYFGYQ